MKPIYNCSYDFDDKNKRKPYKFIVISKGDLDLNGAMLLKGKKDVNIYLKENEKYGSGIEAILEIKKWIK